MLKNANKKEQKEQFICQSCNSQYNHLTSLYRHKKKCKNDANIQLTNLVLEVVKQNQELIFQHNETQKQFVEVCKTIQPHNTTTTNSHEYVSGQKHTHKKEVTPQMSTLFFLYYQSTL